MTYSKVKDTYKLKSGGRQSDSDEDYGGVTHTFDIDNCINRCNIRMAQGFSNLCPGNTTLPYSPDVTNEILKNCKNCVCNPKRKSKMWCLPDFSKFPNCV